MGDVDAARLQSVSAAGGTGYIYTNSDLFVLHARIICDIVLQICITRIHWRIYNKLHIFVNHFYFNGQQFWFSPKNWILLSSIKYDLSTNLSNFMGQRSWFCGKSERFVNLISGHLSSECSWSWLSGDLEWRLDLVRLGQGWMCGLG